MQNHKIFIILLALMFAGTMVPADYCGASNFASSGRKAKTSEKKARTSKKEKAAREDEKKVKWVRSKWGIKMLMLMNKDQGEMKKVYASEDESYRSIKKAIEHNVFSEGYPDYEVKKKYGEPVVELSELDGGARWVYKPGASSYFDGEKAYLFFTPEGKLLGWELTPAKEVTSAVE